MYCSTEKWDSLTRIERAKLLAKDVISIVQQEVVIPTRGTYFNIYVNNPNPMSEVRDYITKDNKCRMCGIAVNLAVLFLARDNFKVVQSKYWADGIYIDPYIIRELLDEVFDTQTILDIESYFECWDEPSGLDGLCHKDRLIKIMQVIEQHGCIPEGALDE